MGYLFLKGFSDIAGAVWRRPLGLSSNPALSLTLRTVVRNVDAPANDASQGQYESITHYHGNSTSGLAYSYGYYPNAFRKWTRVENSDQTELLVSYEHDNLKRVVSEEYRGGTTDAASEMYTLEGIYNRLDTGAAGARSGKTFWGLSLGAWGLRTGTMANVGAQSITPGTSAQTITQGYHDAHELRLAGSVRTMRC